MKKVVIVLLIAMFALFSRIELQLAITAKNPHKLRLETAGLIVLFTLAGAVLLEAGGYELVDEFRTRYKL